MPAGFAGVSTAPKPAAGGRAAPPTAKMAKKAASAAERTRTLELTPKPNLANRYPGNCVVCRAGLGRAH